MMSLPASFVQRVTATFEPDGASWLAALPALLAEFAARWELDLGPPFALSYNYVAPARRADGTRAVLKLGVPCGELSTEIDALRHYAGRGACRLLAADEERGALLLERLLPGDTLAPLARTDDAAATRIAAQVMSRLWAPPPSVHRYPTVERWAAGLADVRPHFGGGTGPFPPALLDRAEGLFAELLPSQAAPVVLHGDLHHMNILAASPDLWRAIDPKGIIGEPAYEVGALMRNPIPDVRSWPELPRVLERRIAVLAETLELDRRRIHGWSLAQAVLSAWWSVEDNPANSSVDLAVAEALMRIRV